jgi:folate-binding protein YgfZ
MAVVLDRTTLTARGPDAAEYLQSMLSNDVSEAAPGGAVYALLLTAKARVIADLELFNTGDELVLACDPSRRDDVLATLVRSRFRRKVELEPSGHAVVWGDADGALATLDTPIGPYRLVSEPPADRGDPAAWETARIEAGIPRYGREFDGDTMPAEAGLDERAVSFSKGCYPGQEPVARLYYRGHPNRGVRGLWFPGDARPQAAADVVLGEKRVGRVTSPVVSPTHGSIALAVLRREVPDEAEVDAGGVAGVVKALPFGAAMA